LVQNFLNSLKGGNLAAGGGSQNIEKPFTTLVDLLPSTTTIPIIDSADDSFIDALTSHLPPMILLLAQEVDDLAEVDPTSDTAQAAIEALSSDQKKDILRRVLRSPQLHQSLGSLTMALRDGGLPTISEALKINVENGGYVRGGGVPMGGGDAVQAFLEGVKRTVENDERDQEKMQTD
jgi:26S proteasome regulatory subunit N13